MSQKTICRHWRLNQVSWLCMTKYKCILMSVGKYFHRKKISDNYQKQLTGNCYAKQLICGSLDFKKALLGHAML